MRRGHIKLSSKLERFMYKKTVLIVTILVCATVLLAVFLHEQAHRFDIVAVGAGAGGSNEDKGDEEIGAWLIDHKTGDVWSLEHRRFVVPAIRVGKDGIETKK
jgi:hypothetical protein